MSITFFKTSSSASFWNHRNADRRLEILVVDARNIDTAELFYGRIDEKFTVAIIVYIRKQHNEAGW